MELAAYFPNYSPDLNSGMDVVFFNISWMLFNLFLAALPVFFCWAFFGVRSRLLRMLFILLWLIFMPNTIYIFTDLTHIPEQWPFTGLLGKILLLVEYLIFEVLGFVAYILALYPFEKFLLKKEGLKRRQVYWLVTGLNLLLGLGVVLGRVERLNSWEFFSDPQKTFAALVSVLTSPEMILLSLMFAIFANFFYYLFRRSIVEYFIEALRKLNRSHIYL